MRQKIIVVGILLASGSAFAGAKLPNPAAGKEICFTRVYSPEHMKAHPTQSFNGVAVTVERSSERPETVASHIYVISKSGHTLFSAGRVLDVEKTLGKPSLPSQLVAQMEGDGGSYRIIKMSKNPKLIQVKVESPLSLDDVHAWIYDASVPEGAPYEKMSIEASAPSGDSVANLFRTRRISASDPRTCREMLEDAYYQALIESKSGQ